MALNVWQPEIVRGRQKQIVEQCRVPVEHRIGSLEMELKLCKNQIDMLHKSYVSVVTLKKEVLGFYAFVNLVVVCWS